MNRSEYTANIALARAPIDRAQSEAIAMARATANGYDRIGQHAFTPLPARRIFTRPTLLQRIVRAIYRAI